MTRIILPVDDAHHPLGEGLPRMPMIDVYAAEGTFADNHALARDLATAVMRWGQVPDLALFRDNTAAFVHDVAADSISKCRRREQLRASAGPGPGRSAGP
jgi:hypothetical protein